VEKTHHHDKAGNELAKVSVLEFEFACYFAAGLKISCEKL